MNRCDLLGYISYELRIKRMAQFEVFGLANAPVEVRYTVEASSEEEVKEITKMMFERGERGAIAYADDDAAAIDFEPLNACEI